jgi:asparagine synthase (glutamine-hydrolysing)
VPGPLTIFQGIHKLPPAHTLVLRSGKLEMQPYWQLSYATKKEAGLDDLVAQFRDIFTQAVGIRLRSDVPLGAFLSGGIDSSAVVALMSRLSSQPVRTFSIGFEESDYDELGYARSIARQFNTEHTEFVVKPEAIKILPRIIRHYDEPFADPSAIPTFYVAQLTRQHVTVALNGDGGDESFAGYERYRADRLAALYVQLPRFVREGIIRRIVDLLPYQDARWSMLRRLKRFIRGAAEDPAQRYLGWLCYFTSEMKAEIFSAAFLQKAAAADSVALMAEMFRRADAESPLERALFADVMLYLPYDLLVKVDIASMAYGLEARSPFLDHKVMEFAAALPPGLKLRGSQTKYFLKRAFADLLPREIRERRKMGFGVPLHRWLRQELKQPAYDILLGSRSIGRGYFKPAAVRQLLDEHIGLRADHSYRIWALLLLELWHRMFIDRSEVLGI